VGQREGLFFRGLIIKKVKMEAREKLFRVTLRGMTTSATGVSHGVSYVVAENTDTAYQKVKKYLDDNDIGFTKDRELDKVELIADTEPYTNVRTLLFL